MHQTSWQKKKGNSQRPNLPAKCKPIKTQSTKTSALLRLILTVHEPDLAERKKEEWGEERRKERKACFLQGAKLDQISPNNVGHLKGFQSMEEKDSLTCPTLFPLPEYWKRLCLCLSCVECAGLWGGTLASRLWVEFHFLSWPFVGNGFQIGLESCRTAHSTSDLA